MMIRSTTLLLLALVTLRAAPLAAQTYTLAPPPYQTVLNNAGAPVSNACVWTYSAGTTTPIATYSTATGTVNPNPIRTDSAGRFTAYLAPGTGYAFTYELPCTPPAHGVVLRTADPVMGTPTASTVTTGTWVPSLGGTATYSVQEGTWGRVGAVVHVRGQLQVNVLGTGSAFIVDGLPFPTAAGDGPALLGAFSGMATPYSMVSAYVPAGSTTVVLLGLPAGGVSVVNANFFGNGTALDFSVTYLTTAP
jgi:hypothetical protein